MTYDDSKNHLNFWVKAFLAALGSFLGAAGLSAGGASAGSAVTETVLYSFCQQPSCADGKYPAAGLIATNQGALYGTTPAGVSSGCVGVGGCGVAFLLAPTGAYMILHAFQGTPMDGDNPVAPLFRDKSGNLFGTTVAGGINEGGTVFERSAGGVYSLRHRFNGTDGAFPMAGVVADSAGNLYGTTSEGGAHDGGTIFRLAPGGTLTTLYSFCSMTGCSDGQGPGAGLIGDANGNLYGTTYGGGAGPSVVFKIHADGTGYSVLHTFGSVPNDGVGPSGLSADASGNLYGTTQLGGDSSGCGLDGVFGCGTVFKLGPDGSNYAVLFNFCDPLFCADESGSIPLGGVILDAGGNLYGTAVQGGPKGGGVVFSLTPSGTFTVLYSFCSLAACADGSSPVGNLVALGNGNLYGTTEAGGVGANCPRFEPGCGTVYQLTNTGFVP